MNRKIMIGKYTLESLTSGMYLSALDIYREYVQNAADSIDQAVEKGILDKGNAHIIINIDPGKKSIAIWDNGEGIQKKEAENTLLDIGNSKKILKRSRGFRGIGRLAGLGYCRKLIFSTSYIDEEVETNVIIDAALLHNRLLPDENDKEQSLDEVLESVVTVERKECRPEKHYFSVTMEGVTNADLLLERKKVTDYLTETLPLPFAPEFVWGTVIESKLRNIGYIIPEYRITLVFGEEREQLFKPYRDTVLSDRIRRVDDNVKDVEFRIFKNKNENQALLWFLKTSYYGTVLDAKVKGIRMRSGNIMLGNYNTLREFFKEERFNGWLCGELIILSDKLIPNSRRDGLERNEDFNILMEQFSEWTKDISKTIRSISYKRSNDAEKRNDISGSKKEIIKNNPIKGEADLIENVQSEAEEVSSTDFFSNLSVLAGMNYKITRYKALNISRKISNEQKKAYESAFDVIYEELTKKKANQIVEKIIEKYC